MNFKNIFIILINPKKGGNIGAASRAMKNMGIENMIIVKDKENEIDKIEALKMSCGAEHIWQNALIYKKFENAMKHVSYLVGTTRRQGKRRGPFLTPYEMAIRLNEISNTNKVGIVFGPEDAGLTNQELKSCNMFVTIPAKKSFESLNLAQAVLIICYELFLLHGRNGIFSRKNDPVMSSNLPELLLCSSDKLNRFYETMKTCLLRLGFLLHSNPDYRLDGLKRIFNRAGLEEKDVNLLMGVFRKVKWLLDKLKT